MTDQQSEQIERLYFELFAKMTAYANSVLRNRALAEEAVQETFRIACMKPEALCDSPNPQGWLLVTLKNVLNNTVRSVVSANRLAEKIKNYYEPASNDTADLRLLYGSLAD
jgi:RNA polymerase sigma-70 factor (ECF subfamily)